MKKIFFALLISIVLVNCVHLFGMKKKLKLNFLNKFSVESDVKTFFDELYQASRDRKSDYQKNKKENDNKQTACVSDQYWDYVFLVKTPLAYKIRNGQLQTMEAIQNNSNKSLKEILLNQAYGGGLEKALKRYLVSCFLSRDKKKALFFLSQVPRLREYVLGIDTGMQKFKLFLQFLAKQKCPFQTTTETIKEEMQKSDSDDDDDNCIEIPDDILAFRKKK